MQNSLVEADRVLRAALAELTGSPAVFVVLHDGKEPVVAEGAFPPAELVRPEAIAATAREQRPVVAPRLALFPILAATASIGVIVIGRPPTAPAYAPPDLGVAAAAAHECAGLLNNLLAGRRRDDAAASASPLFRREAIDHFRRRGHEGPAFRVSPGWVRWAYPTLLLLVGGAIAAAALARVPTYSTGSAIVLIEGHQVTARNSGVVEEVYVTAGQEVQAGQELARLHDNDEAADLDEATAEYEDAMVALLFDPTDRNARASAIALAPRAKRAMERVGARILRAPSAGRVRDVRIHAGSPIAAGEHVLTIVDDSAEPIVVALMPSRDLPRIHEGMDLMVRLEGYGRSREVAKIVEVGREGIGPMAARKSLGEELADSLPIAGSVVMVRAKMPHRDFDTGEDRRLELANGMTATGEVKIAEQSFLRTLVPGLGEH
ncbi:MAG TPA: HlyD family efflux transporter periplasmic adaptor subunit, partial [Kofleriaceae bacterium]|nr:HlyD family efflux transporter periplasmic adaptor subunit [Kofleriaceae bacterium]